MIQYTLTNDTVTVIVNGEPQSVTKGASNYAKLREAVLREGWDAIPGLLTVEKAVETWISEATKSTTAKATQAAQVKVVDEQVQVDGKAIPNELNDRILKMTAKGESAQGLLAFWQRLQRNPNPHSVKQLFAFLQHTGIPIQEDGTFLAYKGVRKDFRDCHSGTFDNSPGKTIKMDRAKVSPDPKTACHAGLHVGAIGYARNFSQITVICRVDPADVVCVPDDHYQQKMRVCEYTVVGLYGAQMPDTSFKADAPVQYDAPAPIESDEDDYEEDEDGTEDEGTEAEAEGTEYETLATPTYPVTGTMWDEFNQMTPEELAGQSLGELRKYALYNCGITGASKLPGGKDALLQKIREVCQPKVAPAPAAPAPVVEEPPPAPVVEETPPTPANVPGMKLPLTGTAWDRLNGLNTLELLQESIEDLRRYARHNCLIVGASKMGGGKVALIARIAEVRGDQTAS
jgi:hypothetical protein